MTGQLVPENLVLPGQMIDLSRRRGQLCSHAVVTLPFALAQKGLSLTCLLWLRCSAHRGFPRLACSKSHAGAKNGDCHQFASRHDPKNKALSLKRIGRLYPIFRDLHFHHGLLARISHQLTVEIRMSGPKYQG